MVRASRISIPTEHDEQRALFQWAALNKTRLHGIALMFAVPNGGDRNRVVAAKLKGEGVRAGVPDIFLPVARGGHHGLFIEMKRRAGGRVSEAQKGWIGALVGQGYRVEVCRGFEEAAVVLEEYLNHGY